MVTSLEVNNGRWSFSALATSETDFGLELLRQSSVSEQLVVSPLSVIFALVMVQTGAKGKTRTQINNVIAKGESNEAISNFYSNLSRDILNENFEIEAKIANAFFLDKMFTIEKEYVDNITKKYHARVQALDFRQAKQAAKTIDGFVNDATSGKIKNVVTEDTLKNGQSLIISAIYFTANWEFKFKKSALKKTFYSSENKQRKIEFLQELRVDRYYTENKDMRILSLRYKDTSYSFNILLPKKRFALDALRKNLSGAIIQKLLSQLQPTYVTITIPKMKIETDFNLKQALVAMGVTEMFADTADLTGIAKSPPLKVSEATHKAIIEVDEEGTTASAATVVRLTMKSAITKDPIEFIADHPFIFVLTKNNNPLFIGQFV